MASNTTNTYLNRIPAVGDPKLCPASTTSFTLGQLMDKFPNGITSDKLQVDGTSGRISVASLGSYVTTLKQEGKVPSRPTVGQGKTLETDMNKLVKDDAAFYDRVKNEYCFYEQRYRFALKRFFELATTRSSADNTEAKKYLQASIDLNRRLNSMMEILNYIALERVRAVESNKAAINAGNASIQTKLNTLSKQYSLLSKDNAILETQKEMVAYTQEKNRYTANQIAVFTALNVLALGTIFYVYRH